jgi:hypothetical protein
MKPGKSTIRRASGEKLGQCRESREGSQGAPEPVGTLTFARCEYDASCSLP